MNKVGIIFGAITILIIIAGTSLLGSKNTEIPDIPEKTSSSRHQYFWSETCPHCANVSKFMDTWERKDSFDMESVEVNESKENYTLFLETGTRICGLDPKRLGVPLLITPDGECYYGDTPIIEYLENEI